MKILTDLASILAGLGVFAFFFWFASFVVLLWVNLRFGFQPPAVNVAIEFGGGTLSAGLAAATTYVLSHAVWAAALAGSVAALSLVVVFILT